MRANRVVVLIIVFFEFTRVSIALPALTDFTEVYNYRAQPNNIEMVYGWMSNCIITLGQTKLTKQIGTKESSNADLLTLNPHQDASAENMIVFDDASALTISTRVWFILLSVFAVGAFIGAWFVFYFSKRKIYSILQEERIYYLDYPPLKAEKSIFHYITLFHILKRRKDSYKKLNLQLRKEMEQLESENDELKSKS